MNTHSNAMPETPLDAQGIVPALSATRPLYWAVRRELWEYRSIYIAPLAGAGVAMFGFLISLIGLPRTMHAMAAMDAAHGRSALGRPYHFAEALILGAAFLVSIFYSLDALYGERRDRSILFWKSLPVSDLTTVLAKASIPLVVLPVLAFAITCVTESIMLLFSSLVLLANGLSVATLWTQVQLYPALLGLLYHLVTMHILWYAPLYAWLLLVSAWARRAPILWAVLPPLALGIFENIAFHSSHFAALMEYRVTGGGPMQGDFPMPPGMHFALGNFLSTPGLWLGLIVAAAFLAGAVRLRRYREPI